MVGRSARERVGGTHYIWVASESREGCLELLSLLGSSQPIPFVLHIGQGGPAPEEGRLFVVPRGTRLPKSPEITKEVVNGAAFVAQRAPRTPTPCLFTLAAPSQTMAGSDREQLRAQRDLWSWARLDTLGGPTAG